MIIWRPCRRDSRTAMTMAARAHHHHRRDWPKWASQEPPPSGAEMSILPPAFVRLAITYLFCWASRCRAHYERRVVAKLMMA